MQNIMFLLRVRDIGINEQRIRLGVNGLRLVLDRIEVLGLGPLNLSCEAHRQILHHNAVRARKEAEDVFNKVALIVAQLLPVRDILAEIHLLGKPLDGEMVLGHLEEVVVLNGKEYEAVLIFLKHWLRKQWHLCNRVQRKRFNNTCARRLPASL